MSRKKKTKKKRTKIANQNTKKKQMVKENYVLKKFTLTLLDCKKKLANLKF